MRKVLAAEKEYMLLEVSDGLILINNKGAYRNHTHIHDYDSGIILMHLVANEIIPNSTEDIKSLLRVVLNPLYKERLKKVLISRYRQKQKGGKRKCK